jgi:hypothetical protein
MKYSALYGVLLLGLFGSAVAAEPKWIDNAVSQDTTRLNENSRIRSSTAKDPSLELGDDEAFIDRNPARRKSTVRSSSNVTTKQAPKSSTGASVTSTAPKTVTPATTVVRPATTKKEVVEPISGVRPLSATTTAPVSVPSTVVIEPVGSDSRQAVTVTIMESRNQSELRQQLRDFEPSIQNLLIERDSLIKQIEKDSLSMVLEVGSLKEPILVLDSWSDGYGQFDSQRLKSYLEDGNSSESARFTLTREIKALKLLSKALLEREARSNVCVDACESEEYVLSAQGTVDRLERFLEVYPNSEMALSVALNAALIARADGRWSTAKTLFEKAVSIGESFEKARKARDGYVSAMTERALLRLWQVQLEIGDEPGSDASLKDIRARSIARGIPNWGVLPKEAGMICSQRAVLVLTGMSDADLLTSAASLASIVSNFDDKQPTLVALQNKGLLYEGARFWRLDKSSLIERKVAGKTQPDMLQVPTPALVQLSSGRLVSVLKFWNGAYHISGPFGEESWMLHRHLVREMTGVIFAGTGKLDSAKIARMREATQEEIDSVRVCVAR